MTQHRLSSGWSLSFGGSRISVHCSSPVQCRASVLALSLNASRKLLVLLTACWRV